MTGEKAYPSLLDAKRRVITAICVLYRQDRELLSMDANERSITHKLAEYLQDEFPDWNVDCEYNRLGGIPKRLLIRFSDEVDPKSTEAITVFPDIIVHRRGTKQNLIVIEVKKASGQSNSDQSKTKDIVKLEEFTRDPNYKYLYGLLLKLNFNGSSQLKLYLDGEEKEDWGKDLQKRLKGPGYEV
ncbi:MAG: hypothetical protein A4E49_00015 [Methanosaeta sp. PtaU1.Bin112]|nr:MAG: hypothetical protein A4E49_00015 [Methanosaeta sp. PtaU1.Bin112]